METSVKIGAVSYLNTKPLLYGIEHSDVAADIVLSVAYPSMLAQQLRDGVIDMALLPVAAIPGIPGARIVSDYGIASDGNVVSVAIFSQVPMEEITEVFLDYQSRTSVKLAEILLRHYWKKDVKLTPAHPRYIEDIKGTKAGVIIGDRALRHLKDFTLSWDLSAAWKDYTGLDFVFAAWVANKDIPQVFMDRFNAANAEGLQQIDKVIAETDHPWYDLNTYYRKNICYRLDEQKRKGLERFLEMIQE